MSSVRGVALVLALVAALAGAACGNPPDKELQEAQRAVDAARAAGAEQFARDELTAAQDALKRATDAVAQRDYRLALNNALDARERAQTAAKQAAEGARAARTRAERALADAATALADARARLRAAEGGRVPPKTLAASRRTIATGDQALQKARTTFERGEYLAAIDAATRTASDLRATARDLAAVATPAPRRRR
jgi:hypothetical protein